MKNAKNLLEEFKKALDGKPSQVKLATVPESFLTVIEMQRFQAI